MKDSLLLQKQYNFYINYTINNYEKDIEPNVPNLDLTIGAVRILNENKIPIRWRYDTILLTDYYTKDWHLSNFKQLCKSLECSVSSCTFSFCNWYPKVEKHLQKIGIDYYKPTDEEKKEMASKMLEIACAYDISLLSCSDSSVLIPGIGQAHCIDPSFSQINVGKGNNRKECGCAKAVDIGTYGTCNHECIYCYAT